MALSSSSLTHVTDLCAAPQIVSLFSTVLGNDLSVQQWSPMMNAGNTEQFSSNVNQQLLNFRTDTIERANLIIIYLQFLLLKMSSN